MTLVRYLHGAARKVRKLRKYLGVAVEAEERRPPPEQVAGAVAVAASSSSSSSPQCLSCTPVLEKVKGIFNSFVCRDQELRHSKRVLPEPRKPDKLNYCNLVAQNHWIRSNLFDALGNYKYCQKCITRVLNSMVYASIMTSLSLYRNSDSNAELRVREDCSAGDLHITELNLHTGSSREMQCFPAPHFNYFGSKREISTEKISDMHTMYSRFITCDRWPSYLRSQHPSKFSEPEPTQQI